MNSLSFMTHWCIDFFRFCYEVIAADKTRKSSRNGVFKILWWMEPWCVSNFLHEVTSVQRLEIALNVFFFFCFCFFFFFLLQFIHVLNCYLYNNPSNYKNWFSEFFWKDVFGNWFLALTLSGLGRWETNPPPYWLEFLWLFLKYIGVHEKKIFLLCILLMPALFSDAPISTRKNGFTLFM